MNKTRKVKIFLPFVFGLLFVIVGLSLYGVINDGLSLGAGLVNPAFWFFGLLFCVVLALGRLKGRHGC